MAGPQLPDENNRVRPDEDTELTRIVARNIQSLVEMRQKFEREKRPDERVADAITAFVGSIHFVYLQAFFFGIWLLLNSRLIHGLQPFDPFPCTWLALLAAVEAIFLSTFILIDQNRMEKVSERRDDLDLQINLLTEHELTRLIALVDAIARHVGVQTTQANSVQDLKRDVHPDMVLDKIEKEEELALKKPIS